MIEIQQQQAHQQTQYDIWKQNAYFMYDLLVVNELLWPSLTFQWLPDKNSHKNSTIYSYAFGTNTKGDQQGGQQYLHIAEIQLPNDSSDRMQEEQYNCNFVPTIIESFRHPQQVNRVKYNTLNPHQLATKTVSGKINIYQRGCKQTVAVLKGHTEEGYGIDWKQHGLLSCGYDKRILVWKNIFESPVFNFIYDDKVEDVKWIDAQTFVSVADDQKMSFWDLRSNKRISSHTIHNGQVYTIDVNSFSNNLMITGGEDHNIRLWDRRNLTKKLYAFESHKQSVIRVEWSQRQSNIFCSGSLDKKIMIWDILRIGNQVPKDDTNAGPGELLFTHSGHQGPVSDLNWNANDDILGSVQQEKNGLHIFKMARNIRDLEYIEDVEYQRNEILS